MDPGWYWFGVILAILSGVVNNYGTLLQKKVVNKYRDDDKFMRSLAKNPIWLFGLILQMVVGGLLFFIAQMYIGPTLIPGLMAAGLIVLAVGSVRLLGEQLNISEIIGIILMIGAIALIGFSNMAIDLADQDFLDSALLIRISLFTGVLFGGSAILYILYLKRIMRGISLAIFSGLMFALSNFWVSPLMGVLTAIFSGTFVLTELLIFIFSLILLAITNYLGIVTIQKSLREGQVSNLIPIQQVPIQIAPPFYYLIVFLLPIPNIYSLIFLISGVALVIVSSFLLGKRQAQIETLK